jgi:hypothetical protein
MNPNNQGYGQQPYYNGQQQYQQGYNGPPQQQYQQQQYNQGPSPQQYDQQYNQGPPPQQYQQYNNNGPSEQQMPHPPSYGQNYSSPDGKASFENTFKVERPKWNDVRQKSEESHFQAHTNRRAQIWAGILLIAVFLGYTGVSGYCLYYYSQNSGLNNGGFDGTDNTFGLNGNTLVLFAFVLLASLVLGYGYMAMARTFTKQFIWISGVSRRP